jgi:hypothetical protein
MTSVLGGQYITEAVYLPSVFLLIIIVIVIIIFFITIATVVVI